MTWIDLLERNPKTGELIKSLDNLIIIFENDQLLQGICANAFTGIIEVTSPLPWHTSTLYWRDADYSQLECYIERTYGSFSRKKIETALIKVTDDRSFHPVRDYLTALPSWDGHPRAETLLIDYLGAKDDVYVRAVTRKILCAAIMRIQNPGTKFDNMAVLVGPQGVGKSTLIAKLGVNWFSDSLKLYDTRDKTAAEKLQGYWLLEIGELDGMRQVDCDTLKAFVSRTNDIYRAAYGRHTQPHPRQCIFVGTTNNNNGFLTDTTGNRRFWPITVSGVCSKKSWDLMPNEIDQIWAEALLFVKNGESLCLSQEEEAIAVSQQKAAMVTDDREGLIHEFLEKKQPANWNDLDVEDRKGYYKGILPQLNGVQVRTQVCVLEVWCELFGRDRSTITRRNSDEIASMLIKLGWKRAGKARLRLYGPQNIFVRDI